MGCVRCAIVAMFVLAAGCHTAPAAIEEPPAPELALALEADPAHPRVPSDGRPVADEEIARLLDWRVALPRRARVAMIEMRAFRETLVSRTFGEPAREAENPEW